ncbi:MAG: hypothetical protein K2N14_00130 [Clostridia bacterium]|nr:hypothetical protein [Clostridia bacterium]
METFRIIFISLSCGLLVLSLYFFIKKITLTNKSKMNENYFVMSSEISDIIITLVAEIIIFTIVSALNIARTLNITYNLISFTLLVLLSICQIIICRRKFIIKNNEITVFPAVGKAKKFIFSDISIIREFKSTKGIVFYTAFQGQHEMFAFSERYIGSDIFIFRARKQRIKFSSVE